MAKVSPLNVFLILVFGILTPTLDQYTDLTLVIRLLSGPSNSTVLKTGKHLNMQKLECNKLGLSCAKLSSRFD